MSVDLDVADLSTAQLDDLAKRLYPRMVARRRLFELSVYAWLLAATIAVTISLVAVFDDIAARNREAAATASQAQASCLRAIEFAPALGVYFLHVKALTPKQDAAYTDLLPSHC